MNHTQRSHMPTLSQPSLFTEESQVIRTANSSAMIKISLSAPTTFQLATPASLGLPPHRYPVLEIAMAAVKSLVRRIFYRDVDDEARELNLRLRKAVENARPRQVAALLDEGASPVWMPSPTALGRRSRKRNELNALLLACQFGDVTVLSLLMDALFMQPDVLHHFSRAMYSLVIRHGHWRAFTLLQQRRIPVDQPETTAEAQTPESVNGGDLPGAIFGSCASLLHLNPYALKLPRPAFVAAEYGRHEMLISLLRQEDRIRDDYSFKGHSLLTIATRYGHYECVEALLAHIAVSRDALEAAVACAKRHRQAHVLVLLTSCQPEFQQPDSGGFGSNTLLRDEPFETPLSEKNFDFHSGKQSRFVSRGSLAETVASDGEGEVDEEGEFQRDSMVMWLMDDRNSLDKVKQRVDSTGQSRDVVAVMRSARSRSHEKRMHTREEPGNASTQRSKHTNGEIAFAHGWNMPPVGFLPSISSHSASGHSNDSEDDDYTSAYKPFRDSDDSETDESSNGSPPTTTSLSTSPVKYVKKSPPMAPAPAPSKIISIRSQSIRMQRSLPAIDENETGESEA